MAQGNTSARWWWPFRKLSLPGELNRLPFAVKQNGSYLITGAFGGFGKVIARWLVEAAPLVLASRSGPASPEAESFVEDLRRGGMCAWPRRTSARLRT